MVRNLKMIRFRVVFTGLFLLLNKVCLGSTASFKIKPFYESYYGFNPDYHIPEGTDQIFYQINGGLRVVCNATLIQSDSTQDVLEVLWFEKVDNKYVRVPATQDSGIWDPGNKTLIFSPSTCTPDLAEREFACQALENKLYTSFSTPQTMTLSFIDKFATSKSREFFTRVNEQTFITCPKPSGAPEPEIYFTHNDTKIDTEREERFTILSSDALRITNLTFEDNGVYRCTAANAQGEVNSPTTTITVEPMSSNLSFVQKPEDMSPFDGETVTLTCKFNRIPQTYGWQYKTLNDQPGAVKEKTKLDVGKWVVLDGGNLVINKIDRNDSGRYTCYGRDDNNNIYETAEVLVNYFDTSFVMSPPNTMTVIVGETATISCTVPESYPPALVTMAREDKDGAWSTLSEDDGYVLQQDGLVYRAEVLNSTFDDSGKYRCEAGHPNEESPTTRGWAWISSPGQLKVVEKGLRPQKFSSTPPRLTGAIGGKVEIKVSVLADPAPKVTWFRSAAGEEDFSVVNVTLDSRVTVEVLQENTQYNYTLTLTNLTLADHDTKYYCKLSNKLGASNSPRSTVLVNHIQCQNNKVTQVKTFRVQVPVSIACPEPESAHPKANINWSYNTTTSSLRKRLRDNEDLYTDSLTKQDGGDYLCTTSNLAGSCPYKIVIKPQAVVAGNNNTLILIIAALICIVIIIGMFVAILKLRRRAKKKKQQSNEALERLNQPVFSTNVNGYEDGPGQGALLTSSNSNMTQNMLYSTLSKFGSWQVSKSRLRNFELLGEGQFGSVYKAELRTVDGSPSQWVAIKQIKDDNSADAIREYEKEMLMMTQLHHPNIVKLVGLCTDSLPYYILTEYMEKGNLTEFLQDIAQSKADKLNFQDQIHILVQIASGLNYMADKQFVHRDVAARNCLVAKNLVVKVADFGLSRSVHGRDFYQKDGGTVPIRWMSPESIQYGNYTTANDVWAYGVTIWEVFSYGVIPYSAWNNEDVSNNVLAGSRLIRPENCPQSVYNIMLQCWSELPDYRPTFGQIIDFLNAL